MVESRVSNDLSFSFAESIPFGELPLTTQAFLPSFFCVNILNFFLSHWQGFVLYIAGSM